MGKGFGGRPPSLDVERDDGRAEVERVPVGDSGGEEVEPGGAVSLVLAGAVA